MEKILRAFSLVEVIIAVAIFATAVVVTLALMPALTRQANESTDTLVALRMTDSIHSELKRLAGEGGFDALASPANTPVMAATMPAGLTMVASKDGAQLHALTYLPPPSSRALGEGEQYFLIELWKFNAGDLVYDPAGAQLALHARVSWPYRTPGTSTPTALTKRQQITFGVSLMR